MALLPTTCSSLHIASTAQGTMGHPPTNSHITAIWGSIIATIEANELISSTQQGQLIPMGCHYRRSYQTTSRQGSQQLPNSPGFMGGPHNNACWWKCQLSHCKWDRHPQQFQGSHELVPHMPPTIHGTISLLIAAPTYKGPNSHYLSFTAS